MFVVRFVVKNVVHFVVKSGPFLRTVKVGFVVHFVVKNGVRSSYLGVEVVVEFGVGSWELSS